MWLFQDFFRYQGNGFYQITDLKQTVKGPFNLDEPDTNQTEPVDKDLALIYWLSLDWPLQRMVTELDLVAVITSLFS